MENVERPNGVATPRGAHWLNRNVVGMGLTSLLSDAGHEMATAVLPGFLAAIGLPPAALGLIEGVADATASFVKIGAGWISDRFGWRKPIATAGYLLTGVSKALFAFAAGLPLVLTGRVLGWFGRGIRGPLRDAMLAESVPAAVRGKAFGFHRAGDTLGAIIGPLVAVGLLTHLAPHASESSQPFRTVFLWTLVPGVSSAAAFHLLVKDPHAERQGKEFWLTLRNLPPHFRRFLWGAGLFGLGDFAHTFMILAATQLLAPQHGLARAAQFAGLLYVLHNIFYASASYPVGALSDRIARHKLLALGYALGACMALGFLIAFVRPLASVSWLLVLFALGGSLMGIQDALEGALTADLTPQDSRGTAYGVLGTVNGVGDLFASVMVGGLWTAFSPGVAFGCAAVLMLMGSAVTYNLPERRTSQ